MNELEEKLKQRDQMAMAMKKKTSHFMKNDDTD